MNRQQEEISDIFSFYLNYLINFVSQHNPPSQPIISLPLNLHSNFNFGIIFPIDPNAANPPYSHVLNIYSPYPSNIQIPSLVPPSSTQVAPSQPDDYELTPLPTSALVRSNLIDDDDSFSIDDSLLVEPHPFVSFSPFPDSESSNPQPNDPISSPNVYLEQPTVDYSRPPSPFERPSTSQNLPISFSQVYDFNRQNEPIFSQESTLPSSSLHGPELSSSQNSTLQTPSDHSLISNPLNEPHSSPPSYNLQDFLPNYEEPRSAPPPYSFSPISSNTPLDPQSSSSSDTTIRVFPCPDCCKVYSRQSTLYNHRRTHSTATPFRCEICNKSFKLPSSLYNHRKNKHSFIL